MKVIKLMDGFCIMPTDEYWRLRHTCTAPKWHDLWPLDPMDIQLGKCDNCNADIPPKVIFMANLWRLQNNR